VSGVIVCPDSVGVRTIDDALSGTPAIVYTPLPFVVAAPLKPPLAPTWTPPSPTAFSVMVPPML
jgi:hypothetical protein